MIDRLFANLGSGAFGGSDPHSIPQEGGVGQGTIQGTGFVQSGGAPFASFGGIAYAGAASPAVPQSVSQGDAWLAPFTLPGLLSVTQVLLELGSDTTTSVFEAKILADLGQGGALTVVATASIIVAPGALAVGGYALGVSPTVLPPGNYWLLLIGAAITSTNGKLGMWTPYIFGSSVSGTRVATGFGSTQAVGDQVVIDYTAFSTTSYKLMVGGLAGRVLGIASDF